MKDVVVFWDFDGTLTHSDSLWGGSIFAVLRSVVPNIPDALCQRVREHMWGGYPWELGDRPEAALKGEAWWAYVEGLFAAGCVSCGLSAAVAKRASERLRPTVKQPARYTLYDDALPTLRETRARGAKNVLLSNNYPDLDEVLDALGLTPLFDGAVISGKVGCNKPERAIFEQAKALFPGAGYLMVGDNPEADVLGGRQSGIKTVLVHGGRSAQADFCFEDLRSVLTLI